MTVTPATEPPRTIDKYDLLERVGEGGMAVVYRARHQTLGREVAVKLLHPHLSRIERNRVRFEREAMAIESLAHEHIVQIYDYSGKDSPECYIVTEFIHGVTLGHQLEVHGKLPSEVTAMIAIHLCEALHYAHSRGFIHRDIKPGNVMIRNDGVVKLMDFGIARALDEPSVTITGGLVGSPAYMSPEQASDGRLDARSDLFSIGTLLYQCATGHHPFGASTAPVILHNILAGDYVDPEDPEPGIAPELSEIIRKLLSNDPGARYQTAQDLQRDLEQFLEASEMDYAPSEIQRYLKAPAEYTAALETHLGRVLARRGKALIEQGDQVTALKLFNRALHLDENNREVLNLLQALHQSRKHRARHIIAAMFVLLVPVGAILGLSLENFFSGDGPTIAGHGPLPTMATDNGRTDTPGSVSAPTPLTASRMAPAPVHPAAAPPNGSKRHEGEPDRRTPTPGPHSPQTHAPSQPAAPRHEKQPNTGTSVADTRKTGNTGARARDRNNAPPRLAVVNISASPYADIYLNGESYGNSMLRKRPITLPPGAYRLRLVNPRCEVLETELVLKAGQVVDKHYRLTPLPAKLTVKHLPPEAILYLDGKRLGVFRELRQPLVVRAPRQEHVLKAILPGGRAYTWRIPKLSYNGEYAIDGLKPEGAP